jgi:hypothetical protein
MEINDSALKWGKIVSPMNERGGELSYIKVNMTHCNKLSTTFLTNESNILMNIVTQECVPTFLGSDSSDPSSSESAFKYSGAWFCLQRKNADATQEDANN